MFETIVVELVQFFLTFTVMYVGVLLLAYLLEACCDWWEHHKRLQAVRAEAELDRQAAAVQHQIHVLAADLDGDRDLAIRHMADIADVLSHPPGRS